MKLSVTSWSFPECSLSEVAGLSKLLHINAVDLGYFYRSALNKKRILENPGEIAEEVRNLNITIPCLYHLFGDDIRDRNLSQKESAKQNIKDLQSVTQFCKQAAIETIFILPGIINPGQSRREAMRVSAESLKEMMELCQKEGVSLAIEPHVHSYLEAPEMVLELLDKVKDLKVILDYAHFVCLGFTQTAIDPLIPFTKLIHLRQAKQGYLQTGLEKGTINFPAVFGELRDHAFEGYMSIEYVHQDYMNTLYNDVLSETIKMRDMAEEWIKGISSR